MQAVILAGGKGTRFGDITKKISKPMVKIGNKPILWHIISYLSFHGIKESIICTGYKEKIIRKYFSSVKKNWINLKVYKRRLFFNLKFYINQFEKSIYKPL